MTFPNPVPDPKSIEPMPRYSHLLKEIVTIFERKKIENFEIFIF
jgi:hypothetical protein